LSKGNWIASALAACVLAGAAPAAAGAATTTSSGPSTGTASKAAAGSGWTFADDAVCELIRFEPVAAVAKTLIEEKSHGLVGPLLADFAVSMMGNYCKPALKKAGALMTSLYRQLSTPSQPSRSRYLGSLTQQDEATIAGEITINGGAPSPGYVASSVTALCADLRAARSPIATFERYYPKAKLDVMAAMNGVASLTIRRCGLNGNSAGFLVQAILGHLLDNQYPADHDPPLVLVSAPTETRYNNNTAKVSVHYSRFDFSSGIKTCYVYIGYNGGWHPNGAGSLTLYQGTSFNYGVRCVDNAGNYSAWSVTATYTA
jgi:hypothetical protein